MISALGMFALGSLVMLPLAVPRLPDEMPSSAVLGATVALGVMCTGLGFILFITVVTRWGASFGVLVNYLVPAVALAYGAIFLGESITASSVGGLLLVLLGVGLGSGVIRRRRRSADRPRSERRAAHARGDQQQDEHRQHEPVDDEDRVVVATHVAEEPVDREQPAAGRRDRADDERAPPTPVASSPLSTSGYPFSRTAPSMIGTSRRNERRAAASRVSPRKRPALIVIPERETPGARARLCASPTSSPCLRLSSAHVLLLGPPIGPVQHEREDRHQDRDLPRLAEPLLDHALERGADDRRRDRSRRR